MKALGKEYEVHEASWDDIADDVSNPSTRVPRPLKRSVFTPTAS
jgi:hypothetical protein